MTLLFLSVFVLAVYEGGTVQCSLSGGCRGGFPGFRVPKADIRLTQLRVLAKAVAAPGDITTLVEDEKLQFKLDGVHERVEAQLCWRIPYEFGNEDDGAAEDNKDVGDNQIHLDFPCVAAVNPGDRLKSPDSFANVDRADDKLLQKQPEERYLVACVRWQIPAHAHARVIEKEPSSRSATHRGKRRSYTEPIESSRSR